MGKNDTKLKKIIYSKLEKKSYWVKKIILSQENNTKLRDNTKLKKNNTKLDKTNTELKK